MANMERGTTVAFLYAKRWHKDAKVVSVYPEFKNVIRVEKNGQEHLVLPGEVRSIDDHECILERERMAEAEREYSDIILAWKSGKRTNKELAEATDTPLAGIASRVRAARRRGFLK
jgi:hypothetical protein